MTASYLPPAVALKIVKAIEKVDHVVLVGGQATNLWAEGYSGEAPELAEYGPFVSKDVDFFGSRHAAASFASLLTGYTIFSSMDDASPNSAIVKATVDGSDVEIDFLWNVLGVTNVEKRSVDLRVTAEIDNQEQVFSIRVLHPIDCLISRIYNMHHPAIRRRDSFAIRQRFAAHYVLKCFISRLLDMDLPHEWNFCLTELHDFLLRHRFGQLCHLDDAPDHLDILKHLLSDPRLDSRYKEMKLSKMVLRIEKKRARIKSTAISANTRQNAPNHGI